MFPNHIMLLFKAPHDNFAGTPVDLTFVHVKSAYLPINTNKISTHLQNIVLIKTIPIYMVRHKVTHRKRNTSINSKIL